MKEWFDKRLPTKGFVTGYETKKELSRKHGALIQKCVDTMMCLLISLHLYVSICTCRYVYFLCCTLCVCLVLQIL